MSHLHLLPEGSMLPRPEAGHSARQRVAVEGADLDALDAEVRAAGGRIEPTETRSRSIRAMLRGKDRLAGSWYVIPDDAL
jgi:hypothetical protein